MMERTPEPQQASTRSVSPGGASHPQATNPAAAAAATPQQQQLSPIWIDSTTKSLLKRVADDATLLTSVLFNTPTVGCHHVQKHVASRAPKVIEEGRLLGRRLHESYEGLQKDVGFAADFAASVVRTRGVVQHVAAMSRETLERHRAEKRVSAASGSAPPSTKSPTSTAPSPAAAVVVDVPPPTGVGNRNDEEVDGASNASVQASTDAASMQATCGAEDEPEVADETASTAGYASASNGSPRPSVEPGPNEVDDASNASVQASTDAASMQATGMAEDEMVDDDAGSAGDEMVSDRPEGNSDAVTDAVAASDARTAETAEEGI